MTLLPIRNRSIRRFKARQNVSRYGAILQWHFRRPASSRIKRSSLRSWQEQRQRSTSQVNLTTLSAAGKAKLRSSFPEGTNPHADLYLNVTNGVTGTGQFGNIVLGVDPVTGVDRGNIETGIGLFAYPQKFDDRQTISKVDHHFSERDILTFRYGYEKRRASFFDNEFSWVSNEQFQSLSGRCFDRDARLFSLVDE